MTSPLSAIGAARAAETAGSVALIADGRELTFADLGRYVERAAGALEHEGVSSGARVALRATNRLETVVLVHALSEVGATLVPIHPRFTDREADVLIRDAAPAMVLDSAGVDALLAGSQAISSGPRRAAPSTDQSPYAIVYTSGTSGRPKGAVLGREAFVTGALGSAKNLGWAPSDRWLLCMPICHVGGLSILTRCLIARRPVILEPRFEPRAVLAAIARHRATLLSVVPTMLQALLEDDRKGELARLRVVLVGGAAAPGDMLEECRRRGVPALTTYGLTEACSQVTAQHPDTGRSDLVEPGCGRPLQGVDLRIDDGESLPEPGRVGRILVRGGTRMRCYWGEPVLEPSAWFDTGDVGQLDEVGRLLVYARRSDLIVTGGENVYPIEVEQALEECDGVRRALVFGIPDERWGQVVAAALVPDSCGFDEGRLALALISRLAPHKRPRAICRVEAIPLTGAGKPDRSGMAARYASALSPLRSQR